jgi:hypothetical protein
VDLYTHSRIRLHCVQLYLFILFPPLFSVNFLFYVLTLLLVILCTLHIFISLQKYTPLCLAHVTVFISRLQTQHNCLAEAAQQRPSTHVTVKTRCLRHDAKKETAAHRSES